LLLKKINNASATLSNLLRLRSAATKKLNNNIKQVIKTIRNAKNENKI